DANFKLTLLAFLVVFTEEKSDYLLDASNALAYPAQAEIENGFQFRTSRSTPNCTFRSGSIRERNQVDVLLKEVQAQLVLIDAFDFNFAVNRKRPSPYSSGRS